MMMFADEEGIHFDAGKFWDNDVSTVLQRWADKVGDGEVDRAIEDIRVRWKQYVNKNKAENDTEYDTALKIASHICGEAVSAESLVRQFLFVEIKGGKMEDFLDSVVSEIREEEQKSADELKAIQRKLAADAQAPDAAIILNVADIINDLLCETNKKIIKKEKKIVANKVFDPEYWIKTSVDDVFNYLKTKYPDLDVKEFMRKRLKGARGGSIGNSFRVKKSNNNPLKKR